MTCWADPPNGLFEGAAQLPGRFSINSNLRNIGGIVFDLDDTLYPQESYKRSGFKAVAQWVSNHSDFSASVVRNELENIMHQKGPSYPFIFDCLVGRLNLEKNLVAGMVRVFIDHEPEINCFDGVLEMLSRMSERYRLGILTDGRFSVQRKKIINLGLVEKVDIYLCSDAMGLEKPASMLFQWFESKFGLDGRRLLYVGDNPKKDFIGARTRGWNTIRVLWGEYKKYKTDKEYEADIQVESVSELTYLLSADKINQIPALIDLSGERRL